MKRKKLWINGTILIVVGVGAFYLYQSNSNSESDQEQPFVLANRGTVVEKALAVGKIEPENEIEVKSKISGVVSRIFAEPGTYVKRGDPDAITVAVTDGLEEGEKVFERPLRSLTIR